VSIESTVDVGHHGWHTLSVYIVILSSKSGDDVGKELEGIIWTYRRALRSKAYLGFPTNHTVGDTLSFACLHFRERTKKDGFLATVSSELLMHCLQPENRR
jgi:hypothetical protein